MKSVACLLLTVAVSGEETDTLLQASKLQKHSDGDPYDDVDLTDDPDDTSDDMPLNLEAQPETRGGDSENLPCNAAGIVFKNIEEDCTHQTLFTWKGEVQGDFIAPTYDVNKYTSDDFWKTTMTNATPGWKTLCVAYVNTKKHKKTCKQWCKDQSTKDQELVCNKGMDDAHLQQPGLNEWQGKEGYRETKCTVNPATRLLTSRLSDGKEIDQSENGCNAEWDTQICACALVRKQGPDLRLCSWVKSKGRKPRTALEECTYDYHNTWEGDLEGYVDPTYRPDTEGSDDMWSTGVGLGDEARGRWPGACVAYVKTMGKTCTEWCTQQDMTCVGGMDDAHHQREPLNEWHKRTYNRDATNCNLFVKGHTRQTTENNGCEQRWKTQICACKAL